ncbi:MAG: hypothetical protein ACRC33_01230 [Gemmataceae bacterium]
MYPDGFERGFRTRLRQAGLDVDAVGVIVRAGKRNDVPESLGLVWAAEWGGPALGGLAALTPAERQHALARTVDDLLQRPSHLAIRVNHAARHSADLDLRTCGEVAADLQDLLVAFGRDVTLPVTSPFTGKLKYAVLTDVDVLTTRAIIEVTTQSDASGKVVQLAVLRGSAANPAGLPVCHFMPNVDPGSNAAKALRAAGSAGVYNSRAGLVAAVRGLG